MTKKERKIVYQQIARFKIVLQEVEDPKAFENLMDLTKMMQNYLERDAEFHASIRKGRNG